MIIKVKSANLTEASEYNYSAHVIWEYDLGLSMDIYGDFDKLFTGNALAAYWNDGRNTPDIEAQAFIEELTMDKQVAWSCHIFGNNSFKDGNELGGWRVYSAERFYERPTISHIACEEEDETAKVKFNVHNNFRENNLKPGNFSVTSSDGLDVTSGTFNFHPYWSDNNLEVSVAGGSGCEGISIEVTNHFGQSTTKNISSVV